MQTIVITAGGTGGHLFPAQALAKQLQREGIDVRFMGAGLDRSPYFDRSAFVYDDIPSATFRWSRPLAVLRGMGRLLKGAFTALKGLRACQASALVAFGGFPCVPVLLAARLLGIPIVLHEGNAVPGRVTRFFAPAARLVGLQIPAAARLLRGQCVEIPLPVREGYSRLAWPQEEARRNYGLDPQRLTFLVFGGSQGALALNSLVCSSAAHHLAARTQQFQVIHLTGKEGLVEEIRAEYKGAGIQACVMAFESQMEQAWAAADLVISRAGASSIAEQMAFEIPAILIPYPHSKDHHQDRNADFMEQTVGGAVNMGEEPVDAEMLAQLLVDLVGNDRRRLLEMRARIKEYKVQQHSKDLCAAVCEIAGAKVR